MGNKTLLDHMVTYGRVGRGTFMDENAPKGVLGMRFLIGFLVALFFWPTAIAITQVGPPVPVPTVPVLPLPAPTESAEPPSTIEAPEDPTPTVITAKPASPSFALTPPSGPAPQGGPGQPLATNSPAAEPVSAPARGEPGNGPATTTVWALMVGGSGCLALAAYLWGHFRAKN